MRKSNKEKLYRAAFRLFVTKQFDGVSISDIEKECGMTRGAVFYYAKTKLDLFKQVIEYYIIDTQNVDNKVKFDYGCSLRDYIDRYVGGVEKTMEELVNFKAQTLVIRSWFLPRVFLPIVVLSQLSGSSSAAAR